MGSAIVLVLVIAGESGALAVERLARSSDHCAEAAVVVKMKTAETREWRDVAKGRLRIQDHGQERRYLLVLDRHKFVFTVVENLDQSTTFTVESSPILFALFPEYKVLAGPISQAFSVNGEVDERIGALELRVVRRECVRPNKGIHARGWKDARR